MLIRQSILIHLCKFCCLISGSQVIDQLSDVAVHDRINFVQCQLNSVIRHSP